MAKIELTDKQLRLIQDALEMYSRIGILQLDKIFEHPSIDRVMMKNNAKDKELKVGAQTMRGEIVEMGDGFIKTKGSWGNGEEIKTWTDVQNIQLSPDWGEYHDKKDSAKRLFGEVNRLITNDRNFSNGMSLGIHNENVKECRDAYDIIQVIRHEFWKADTKHSNITVDSSISLTSSEPTVKVQLDTIKEVRTRKIKKIENV